MCDNIRVSDLAGFFCYGVTQEGVVAEICLNISAKVPQTFCTLS